MVSPCSETSGTSLSFTTSRLSMNNSEATTRQAQRRAPSLRALPLVILVASFSFVSAAAVDKDVLAPQITTPAILDGHVTAMTAEFQATAMSPPLSVSATKLSEEPLLELRAPENDEDESTSTTKSVDAKKTSATGSDASPSPLPSPFDNPAPSAFQVPGGDVACPRFMANLFTDPKFKSCYPMSMLIQTSTGLFNAEKQLVSIVKVLDATCKADVSSCTEFLDKAAKNMTSDGNCKTEFQQNQSQVLQAYRGLHAYKVLYAASCLQDPSSNMYCFANAVTNLSTVSDSYLYSMPFGTALPGASTPTCNWCTQNTMSIYHAASADRRQFVASTYESAARQVNTICGPDFVNSTLPSASEARLGAIPSYAGVLANTCIAVLALTWLL